MAGVSLKTDFKDGDKLFGQQLNNNFGAIQAALNIMNKIVWQDDPDDMVVTFRGTTEEINSRDIIDGQLLYDTTTGETYIDYGSQRISTGSGNAIFIGATEPSNPSTQLWINPDEPMQVIGSEVVNSLEGDETNKAPSVKSVNDRFIYSENEQQVGIWAGKPLYRKVYQTTTEIPGGGGFTSITIPHGLSNVDKIWVDNSVSRIEATGSSYSSYSLPLIGYEGNTTDKIYAKVDRTNISVYGNGWGTDWNKVVGILYTKTTDGGAE